MYGSVWFIHEGSYAVLSLPDSITDERWRRIEADTENGHGHDFNEERTPEQLKGEGGWDLKSLYKVRRKHS